MQVNFKIKNLKDRSFCIEFKKVSFGYKNNLVLKDVSFSVKYGDYLGIIGPNGAGKTTLVKLMLGLLKPLSGNVLLFGKNIEKAKNLLYKIGYVPQSVSREEFYFPATVEEVVLSGRVAKKGLLRWFDKKDKKAVEKVLQIVKISDYRHKILNELSGGERQKVFIARALASEPEILILDEPVVGVDVLSTVNFYSLLKEINEKLGITIILITHDVGEIISQATRVIYLSRDGVLEYMAGSLG